jgi:glycosyltransferase involved in cell wall biosynthesis
VDNWNKCLSYATGEYVLNMGDDDRLLPACLQICATLIARHPRLEVYHIRKEIINEKGEIVGLQEDRPDVESVYSMMWHSWKGRNQILAEWLYKTSSLKERGGYYNLPLAWGSDDLTAYIAAQDKGVANTHIPGVQYRVSQVSITSSCRTGDTMQKCEALDKLVAYYKTFLKKEPQNDMDKKYRHFISLELDSIFEAGKGKLIENNLTASLSNIIYWLKVRKRLKVTDRFLLSCFLRAVKAILFH